MTKNTEVIFKRLSEYSYDAIADATEGTAGLSYPITFEKFADLMMRDGWIQSDRTVSQKWNNLLRMGIIDGSKDKATINIDNLIIAMGISAPAKKKIKKNFSKDAHNSPVVLEVVSND